MADTENLVIDFHCDEDLDAPTPPPDSLGSFELMMEGGEEVAVFIGEDSVPWYIHACISNNFDALKKSWGMKTRRDQLREQRAAAIKDAKAKAKAEKERLKAEKKAAKAAAKAEKLRLAEEAAEAKRIAAEEKAKAKAEAKIAKAKAKEAAKKEREKEKKKTQKARQKEIEKRRKAGEDVSDLEDEEEEEEPEEEEDEEEDEEEAVEEEEEEEAEGEAEEEEEEEEEEEGEGEEGEGEPAEGEEGEAEAEQGGDEEDDEDGERSGTMAKIDPNLLMALVGDDTAGTLKFWLRTMNAALGGDGEGEDEEAEPEEPEEDEEAGEDAEAKSKQVKAEDLIGIDVLTLAISQGSAECAALLLSKGSGTSILEEYLEITTTSNKNSGLETFVKAVTLANQEYQVQLRMNFSWLFRAVLLQMSMSDGDKLMDEILAAAVRPSCSLDKDAINSGREAMLYAKLLYKLQPDDLSVAKYRKPAEDGEEEEEPEPEEEEEEGAPKKKKAPGGTVVPQFILDMLHPPNGQLNVAFPLEDPTKMDIPCIWVSQKSFGITQVLDCYWSDLALILLVVSDDVDAFKTLLARKAAIPRVFGKPTGTWELLYRNASRLNIEMLKSVIQAHPKVFTYGGGVSLTEFVSSQWDVLPAEFGQLLTHQFYDAMIKEEAQLRKLPCGEDILAQAREVEVLYKQAADCLAEKSAANSLDGMKEKHALALMNPVFLYKAVQAGNLTAVEHMLNAGCPATIKATEYQQAEDLLRHAVVSHMVDLVVLLVDRGVDLQCKWDNGATTPLRYLKDNYPKDQYNKILDHWKASESERHADHRFKYGLMKKDIVAKTAKAS